MPLEEAYFRWLCSQIVDLRRRPKNQSYWSLLRMLHTKEFIWLIPNDDNRVEDGRDLRDGFILDTDAIVDDHWRRGMSCSFLEMLIALSHRLAFETDRSHREWFWRLLDNLDLTQYSDNVKGYDDVIDKTLDRVIWRTYDYDGEGGLFPLAHSERDQREVELWYQLNAYLLENDE